MFRILFPLVVLLTALVPVQVQASDPNTAKRGVVRVVAVYETAYGGIGGGHGTGFAVSPNRIVTNFHVIEEAVNARRYILAIAPPEGDRPFEARVIGYDRGRDLALLEVREANFPQLTVYTGGLASGDDVAAIGYPGNVDRATIGEMNSIDAIGRYLQPMLPEISEGNYSSERQSGAYERLVHSASIARGSSGGPLVDECGRVVGVVVEQTINTNGDSPFGLAITGEDLVAFLNDADQSFTRIADECVTAEEFAELERARAAEEQRLADAAAAEEAAVLAEQEARLARLEQDVEREIAGERENLLFVAILLLVGGGVAAGGSFIVGGKGEEKKKQAIALGSVGVLMLAGAGAVFVTRPALDSEEIERRLDDRGMAESSETASNDDIDATLFADRGEDAEGTSDNAGREVMRASSSQMIDSRGGAMICSIDRERSRITTTPPQDVDLEWSDDGCVNGSKQYAPLDGGPRWSRVLVPNSDATVSHLQYDPANARLTVDKYPLDLASMTDARRIRARVSTDSCTANRSAVDELADQQAAILAILPGRPSERLVYSCEAR